MSLEFVYFDIQALGLMPRLVLEVTISYKIIELSTYRQTKSITSIPELTLLNGLPANPIQKNPVRNS